MAAHASELIALLAAVVVAGTLLAASIAKTVRREEAKEWFRLLRLPAGDGAYYLALASEIGLVVLVIVAPALGGLLAAGWLVVATAGLYRADRLNAGCGCFGSVRAIGVGTYARNLGLVVTALALAVLPTNPSLAPGTVAAWAALGPIALVARETLWETP